MIIIFKIPDRGKPSQTVSLLLVINTNNMNVLSWSISTQHLVALDHHFIVFDPFWIKHFQICHTISRIAETVNDRVDGGIDEQHDDSYPRNCPVNICGYQGPESHPNSPYICYEDLILYNKNEKNIENVNNKLYEGRSVYSQSWAFSPTPE